MFNHVPANLPRLERETIDGVRFYKVPNEDEFLKLVSITSVTSHWSREKFAKWRKKVGEEKANEITRKATARGTDMHTMTEHYLLNEDLPKVAPMGDMLFKIAKPTLNNIDNIHNRLNEDAAKKFKFKFYKIVEFCNLESCSQLISTDLTAGVFMPVKFAVYQSDNKEKVIISFLKPTAFASIFNSDGMKRIAEILEKDMYEILDEIIF